MKLTLVYPPFSTLTAVPAGICLLKSYLNTHYDAHSVLTMDLNLEMFEWLHQLDFEERSAVLQEIGDVTPLTQEEVERQRRVLRNGTYKGFDTESDITEILSAQDHFLEKCQDALHTKIIGLLLEGQAPDELRILDFIVARILTTKPDIVGISVFSNFQFAVALGVASLLQKNHHIPVVFGGPAMLDFDLDELLTQFPIIDYIILGEAEESLGKFLDAMSAKHSLSAIPGLVYRMANNQFHQNEVALLDSLNDLPFPDYSDLPLTHYYNRELILPVHFSRGCYWRKCTFCALHHTFKDHYRVRPHAQVVQELAYLKKKWNCHLFYFTDLSISPKHIDMFSQMFLDTQLNIKYSFFSRGSSQYTPELLSRLKHSGCVYILWGIESASQTILDKMEKGVNPHDLATLLHNSHVAGIKNYIFVLLGFPGETADDRYETSLFIAKNYQYIDFVCTSTFILDQNSAIYKQQEKYKLVVGAKLPMIVKNNQVILSTHLYEFKAAPDSSEVDLWEYIKKYQQLYSGPLYLGTRGGIYYEHLLSLFLDRQESCCQSRDNAGVKVCH